jgi:hypothetical protein
MHGLRKSTEILKIAGGHARIRTRYVPNMSLRRYPACSLHRLLKCEGMSLHACRSVMLLFLCLQMAVIMARYTECLESLQGRSSLIRRLRFPDLR